jgi:putative flippase GtrA
VGTPDCCCEHVVTAKRIRTFWRELKKMAAWLTGLGSTVEYRPRHLDRVMPWKGVVSTVTTMTLLGDAPQDGHLVTAVCGLHEWFRQLVREAAKFGVVGAIAFLATTVGTNLLHFRAGLGPLTSNVIATFAATCVAFFGNRYWTFRHRQGSTLARDYGVFFALNGIGLAIQLACIGFTYYLLNLHDKLAYNVALIFGIGLGTLFRFWSYRRWVWLAPPVAEAMAVTGGSQPAPGFPVAARSVAWPPAPEGDGHRLRSDMHHTNGNAHDAGHAVRDGGARAAQPIRDGWDN